jgi:HPt (histidine-containing phosphotransfer) domain-containing protein
MSGVEATRIIRGGSGVSRDVPILAVTAHALPSELAVFREAGIDGTLTKPIRLAELSQAIDEALRGAEPGAVVTGGPPTLDEDALSQLRETLPPEVFAKLLDRFVAEVEETIADLPRILSDAGPATARERVHKLAGSAGTFGAVGLQAALAEAERHFKEEPERDPDPAILASLASAWHGVRGHLR